MLKQQKIANEKHLLTLWVLQSCEPKLGQGGFCMFRLVLVGEPGMFFWGGWRSNRPGEIEYMTRYLDFLKMLGKVKNGGLVACIIVQSKLWVFPKIMGTPKSSISMVFHYKPSILGYRCFWKHPYGLFLLGEILIQFNFPF